ncbi:MAG: glycosyltransferase family 1 protein [Firmicutes bacterium]|nr:glycosyltransferase family 1 protein [Bacillota bacterium]
MILIDATPLQSEHRFRGVGTYVLALSQALIGRAPERIQFVLAQNTLAPVAPAIAAKAGYRAYRPHKPAQLYWLYNELFLRRALWCAKPQLFHATDFNGVVRVPGVITVATLHDLTPLKEHSPQPASFSRPSEFFSQWRWRVYFRKIRFTHHLIAISHQVKADAVTRLNIPPERISVIYPGIDLAKFQKPWPQPPAPSQPRYFLAIGPREPHKNFDRLLEAFRMVSRQIPDLHLAIAGRWQPADVRWLTQVLGQWRLQDRVSYLGYVSEPVFLALLQHAMALVYPSLEEGFGLPIVEAMAAGTPVLTSNVGAPKEVAGSAALLVNPTDTPAIADGMRQLATLPRLERHYRARGLARSQQFSWSAVADQTLAVYDALLAERTPKGS